MKIRTKLTLLSVCISGLIIILSLAAVYYSSAFYRRQIFYERLQDKAMTVAKALNFSKNDTAIFRMVNTENYILRNQRTLVLDEKNNIVYKMGRQPENLYDSRIFNELKNGRSVEYQLADSEALALPYTVMGHQFRIFISAYDKYGVKKIVNLRLILLIVSLVSLLVSILAGWFYVSLLLRPIEMIISDVDKISVSNLHQRLSEGNGKDEIAHLAQRFNKMLRRLENSFESQSSFVSNASHELRTPLTTISSQIDVTLLKERKVEDYKSILISVREEMDNLKELVNGLLELAETGIEKVTNNFSDVRIDDLLWQARTEVLERHKNAKVVINFNELPDDENRLVVKGNEQLLKSAMLNLMDNACKFSRSGNVSVDLSFSRQGIAISFKDDGIGISEENISKIFQPFFRAPNAKQIKGHGLGLPLTDRIVRLHKGHINIKSELNKGTVITVFFPSVI